MAPYVESSRMTSLPLITTTHKMLHKETREAKARMHQYFQEIQEMHHWVPSLTSLACQLLAAHVRLLHIHTPLLLALVNGLLPANLCT